MGQKSDESALRERVARLEEQLKAANDNVTRAAHEMEEKMKELNDVRLRFIPREVYDRDHSTMAGRLSALENSRAWLMGWITAVGIAVALISHFWK